MSKLYSKLFRKDNKIEFIDYPPDYSYLKFVDACRTKGYIQIILHSKLILDICEELVSNHHIIREVKIDENSLINIEDLNLNNIKSIEDLRGIRKELAFNDDNYIEIKSVKVEHQERNYVFDLQSNGILIARQDDNDEVSLQLKKLLYRFFER